MAKKPTRANLIAQNEKLAACANRSFNAIKKYRYDHPDDENNDALLEIQEQFRQKRNDLRSDTIRIFELESKDDLEKINNATSEINIFFERIEQVEKVFVVIGSVLDFFAAALNGKPIAIVSAALAVIDMLGKEKQTDQPSSKKA